jgi:hypothetical protein
MMVLATPAPCVMRVDAEFAGIIVAAAFGERFVGIVSKNKKQRGGHQWHSLSNN